MTYRGDRLAHVLGQVEADREAHVPRVQVVCELVRRAGRVAAHDELRLLGDLARQLLERAVEDLDVVGRGVAPAFPGRRSAAGASCDSSMKQHSGWKPKPPL